MACRLFFSAFSDEIAIAIESLKRFLSGIAEVALLFLQAFTVGVLREKTVLLIRCRKRDCYVTRKHA